VELPKIKFGAIIMGNQRGISRAMIRRDQRDCWILQRKYCGASITASERRRLILACIPSLCTGAKISKCGQGMGMAGWGW